MTEKFLSPPFPGPYPPSTPFPSASTTQGSSPQGVPSILGFWVSPADSCTPGVFSPPGRPNSSVQPNPSQTRLPRPTHALPEFWPSRTTRTPQPIRIPQFPLIHSSFPRTCRIPHGCPSTLRRSVTYGKCTMTPITVVGIASTGPSSCISTRNNTPCRSVLSSGTHTTVQTSPWWCRSSAWGNYRNTQPVLRPNVRTDYLQ